MTSHKSSRKEHLKKTDSCHTTIYNEGICAECNDVQQLMIAARALLLECPETEDDSLILAKAIQGNRSLILSIDRDNYEFSLRMPGGRRHVAGGVLSADFKNISFCKLESIMKDYLLHNIPIPKANANQMTHRGWTLPEQDALV